jgi:hypothetical protein
MPKTGKAVFKAIIGGTREEIFREITRTDRPLRALGDARLHTPGLQADARLQFRTATGSHTLGDGYVLVYDPPRQFSHTVSCTRYHDPPFTVTYELRQARTNVELVLTLEDLPVGTPSSRLAMRQASRTVREVKHLVETGRPTAMGRLRSAAVRLLEFTLPSETLTEHWPLEAPRRGGR